MKTSELLGISRKTLWEKMKKLKVENEPSSNHDPASRPFVGDRT